MKFECELLSFCFEDLWGRTLVMERGRMILLLEWHYIIIITPAPHISHATYMCV